jgi:type II secretion system protein G
MKTKLSGFTLIELLIVVAIIAILAAIAVPNFLEAQTRAKVSRVLGDFHAVQVALESYRTDNTDYLPDVTPNGFWIGGTFPEQRFRRLTTPVSYLSKAIVQSPFIAPTDPGNWASQYQYTTAKGQEMAPSGPVEADAYLHGWYRLAAGQQKRIGEGLPLMFRDGPAWMILDRGPDLRHFYSWGGPWTEKVEYYDPSNGTISRGDICVSQMKGSNKN